MNTDTKATTTEGEAVEKVPADAPGYPLGGPEPKSRETLLAEEEIRNEASTAAEREAIDAAKNEILAGDTDPSAPVDADPLS